MKPNRSRMILTWLQFKKIDKELKARLIFSIRRHVKTKKLSVYFITKKNIYFSVKNIFYDKMNLRFFYFRVTTYIKLKIVEGYLGLCQTPLMEVFKAVNYLKTGINYQLLFQKKLPPQMFNTVLNTTLNSAANIQGNTSTFL